MKVHVITTMLIVSLTAITMATQMGTGFTYQGRLLDANLVADGLYDFQFGLYEDIADVNQIGTDVNVPNVDVIDGYFTVVLDFGASAFTGEARWLQIGIRAGELEDPNTYTVLNPRQQLTPIPYALYVKKTDANDGDWIISGADIHTALNGEVGIGITNPTEKLDVVGHINSSETYKLDGTTVLSNQGSLNIFVGQDAGNSNTSGIYNTFSGYQAGYYNTSASFNTFSGYKAGYYNTGHYNTFSGYRAGYSNTTGIGNTISGYQAGLDNTTGYHNTFSGYRAGYSNTTGNHNTFLGNLTGYSNTTGSGNVFIGRKAGYSETDSNTLYIENSDSTSPLIYGEFDNDLVAINGQLKITGGSPAAGKVLVSDANGLASWDNVSDSDWAISGSNIYSNLSGNVGIGTSSPAHKLHVAGKSISGINSNASGGFSTISGGINNEASGNTATIAGGGDNDAFGVGAAIGGGVFNVISSGADYATICGGWFNQANGDYATVPGGASNTAGGDASFAAGNRAKAIHNGTFVWADSTAADFTSTAANQFLIRASGGVGIGTTSSTAELTIGDYDDDESKIIFEEGGNPAASIHYDGVGTTGGNNMIHIRNEISGSEADLLTLKLNGNVGIGDTSPSYKLDVAGDIQCVALHETSDERLKTNIQNLTAALEKVQQLNGVSFEWNQAAQRKTGATAGERQLGLIAQDVEKVLPELVSTAGDGYKAIDYTKLSAVLIEAVKEQQKQIQDLQTQIKFMRAKMQN